MNDSIIQFIRFPDDHREATDFPTIAFRSVLPARIADEHDSPAPGQPVEADES